MGWICSGALSKNEKNYSFWKKEHKTTHGSKTIKYYDLPKTPFQRLMESPNLSQGLKDRLAERRALLNPVVLQYSVHNAVRALLAAHKAKVTFSK
jgi:hypothetical protein